MAPLAERPHREFLFCETSVWETSLPALDLHELRHRFGLLFDRANRALQRTGYDLDDTVFERYIICACDGEEERIAVETVTNLDALTAAIRAALDRPAEPGPSDETIEVQALRVDVILERLPGEPGLSGA